MGYRLEHENPLGEYLENPARALHHQAPPDRAEETIREWLGEKVGDRVAVVGLSGGVDSAVTASLCSLALGPERVYALIMPADTTPEEDVEHAKRHAKKLGISYKEVQIDPILEEYYETGVFGTRIARGNLKARTRMCLLYGLANTIDGIVVGTGNKTEVLLGYYTKYGDGGVDLLPIGDLYKTQVWLLAERLGVDREIIRKRPSARLWEDQDDEKELGMSYQEMDEILLGLELGLAPERIEKLGHKREKIERILELIASTGHKRRPPEVCRVSETWNRGIEG